MSPMDMMTMMSAMESASNTASTSTKQNGTKGKQIMSVYTLMQDTVPYME
jgi:hypothetical protein